MANEKLSVTLDPWIVAEVRELAGDVDLSVFVNDVLHWQLQNVRLRGYLDLLETSSDRCQKRCARKPGASGTR